MHGMNNLETFLIDFYMIFQVWH